MSQPRAVGSESCCYVGPATGREDRRRSAAPMERVDVCPDFCRAAEFFPEHFHQQCSRCGRVWLALPRHLLVGQVRRRLRR